MSRPYAFTAIGRRIIAVDGEGNDIAGRHAYTLLAACDDRGEVRRHITHDGDKRDAIPGIVQPNYGLSTKACLDFLLSLAHDATSDLLVAFSFTYDAVKILSDLPLDNLRELSLTEKTEWEGYQIQFRPRKYFAVAQPRYGKRMCADGKRRYVRQAKVWDAFGYFQKSFVAALADTGEHVFTDDERALIPMIAEMKAHRSHFEDMPEADILEYCYSEVAMLAKMMRDVLVNTEKMGLFPQSFHGASAIAYTWMRDKGIPNYTGEAGIPEDVINGAYFGGRFETTAVGIMGNVHAYDIRSAYPAQMVGLPCMRHATARRVTEYEPGKYGVYLVGSKTNGPWAPFPIRINRQAAQAHSRPGAKVSDWLRPLMSRQVLYSHGGQRWVWQGEVAIARKHFGSDAIPVYDGYVLDIGCDHKPFADVQALYDERARLKDPSRPGGVDGRQMVIKLLVNSLYGKTAQSVGWRVKRDTARSVGDPMRYEAPDTLCRVWAGMITSGTRAQVLDAILRSGTVVSVATDGILSTEPIDGLTISPNLGDWEYEQYRDLVLYQNGVYTYTNEHGEDKIKSRGFSPRDITSDMLRQSWDEGLWFVKPKTDARGFVGLRLAMARKDPLDVMGQWIPQTRPVDFIPSKRFLSVNPYSLNARPAVVETESYDVGHDDMSLAYVPHESWEDVAELEGWISDGNEDTDTPFAQFDLETEG